MVSQAAAIPGYQTASGMGRVIFGSAVGTMIEWYDFYIFGSLAALLSPKFYPSGNETFALIAYLSTFAVGFVVRPFGALFFGYIGDLIGRRYAFLATLSIMGGSTALIGLLPTYKQAGWFAPITLLVIRTLQGLALGGEYGGAAIYVAEHAPDSKRGLYTGFIQITASLGFFLSILAVLGTQSMMSPEQLSDWGWRVPFLASIVLVSISFYTRLKLRESPIFAKMKSSGMTSAKPLAEAFTVWENLKRVLISLFGVNAGQGVVWYTSQFYALFYLQTVLKVNARTSYIIMAIALALAVPLYVAFGALSDKIGRKWIMMTGCLLAIFSFFPIYHQMQQAAGNNVVAVKSTTNKVTGAISLTPMTVDEAGQQVAAKEAPNPKVPKLVLLIFLQVMFACMMYGPMAAYLVELFPAKIRYCSLSLPYHIGNGVFGGLLPVIGLSLCAKTGNIYAGLYYPIVVASVCFVVGSIFLKETHGRRIWDEVETDRPTS